MLSSLLEFNIIIQIILEGVYICGLWKVFGKCERPNWWAFIPGFRDYQLAKCADREEDGSKYFVLCVLNYVLSLLIRISNSESGLINIDSNLALLLLLLFFSVIIASFIFSVRIYLGLCKLFEVSKKWLLAYIFVGKIFPMCFWGFGKKYQPSVIYIEANRKTGAALSGISVETMEEGLTVNIEERTASDLMKKKCLLKDIHLNIEPGHMVLLLGGSGAGKTTFLNAINGYEKAKAEIVLNGTNVYKEYNKMKYRVGFVPQMDLMRGNDEVERTLKDAANLRLPLKMSRDEKNKRIDETLKFFGLEPVKDKLCDKLSGGQRKRLSIAMEYISNPDLFILDEPDSGLDGVMARELMEGLRKIANEGKIVIVITHSPDRVIDLFDDVIVLAKDSLLTGRLAYYGPVDEAKKFFEREKM